MGEMIRDSGLWAEAVRRVTHRYRESLRVLAKRHGTEAAAEREGQDLQGRWVTGAKEAVLDGVGK